VNRPDRLVVVLGTGTEVGKTWVACRLLAALHGRGVAARKPAQSFDAADLRAGVPTDADRLGAATGEAAEIVCPPHRWYERALAPPMAADALGRPRIALDRLVGELDWPPRVAVGLVEAAGGSRSPLAHDGDGIDLARRLNPDLVVLVAPPDLGTIHAVRAALEPGLPWVVVLNRFDPADAVHQANRSWLADRDHLDVVTTTTALAARVPSGR
jgi:dethiobiotin synthetase